MPLYGLCFLLLNMQAWVVVGLAAPQLQPCPSLLRLCHKTVTSQTTARHPRYLRLRLPGLVRRHGLLQSLSGPQKCSS